MSQVNLLDFTPEARFEVGAAVWNRYRVERISAIGDTPTIIRNATALPTAVLDPKNPPSYDFSVVGDFDESGYFRVVFIDTNDVEGPSRWLRRSILPDWAPSVSDVADLLLFRTKTAGGAYVGDFTDATLPSAAQVQRLIEKATERVAGKLGLIFLVRRLKMPPILLLLEQPCLLSFLSSRAD
jgi:hypothetical protein